MRGLGKPFHVTGQQRLVRLLQPRTGRRAERSQLLQPCQHLSDIVVCCSEALAQTSRTEAGRAQQDHPCAEFIHVIHALQFTNRAQIKTAR